jgi:hypothetical protein
LVSESQSEVFLLVEVTYWLNERCGCRCGVDVGIELCWTRVERVEGEVRVAVLLKLWFGW